MVERAGGTGDPASQVEIEEEVLTQPPVRGDAVLRDDLAQRSKSRRC